MLWTLTVSCPNFNDVSNKGSIISLAVRQNKVSIDDIEDLLVVCAPIPPKLILRRNALKAEETYSRLPIKTSSCDEDFFFFLTASVKVDSFVR